MKQSNYIKKPRPLTKIVSEEIKIKVIDDFTHSKNNSTAELAKKHGLSYYATDSIINSHLKSLKDDFKRTIL